MKLEDAMIALRDGKKIRRKNWRNQNAWVTIGGIGAGVNSLDLLEDDWEIFKEPSIPTMFELLEIFEPGTCAEDKIWSDDVNCLLDHLEVNKCYRIIVEEIE